MAQIYMLYLPDCEDVYIGSTTETLRKRYSAHKCGTTAARPLFDKGVPEMYCLENVSKENRFIAEQLWIDFFGSNVLNKINATATREQTLARSRLCKKLWARRYRALQKGLTPL